MNNLAKLDYRMQKRFLKYTFLFIFVFVLAYVMFNLHVAEQITQKASEDIVQEISDEYIKELSKEIVDTGVLERVKDLPIGRIALTKLMQDIIAIQMADRSLPNCEQYVLRVKKSGKYPILQRSYGDLQEIKAWIWLNAGETWRCGATARGEAGRSPNNIYFVSKDGTYTLTDNELEYIIEFKGTWTEVLIEEKIKIYSYSLLPECIARVKTGGKFLAIYPGNKIHK